MSDLESSKDRLQSQPEYKMPVPLPQRELQRGVEDGPRQPLASSNPPPLSPLTASALAEPRSKPSTSPDLTERIEETEAELARISARLSELKQEWERDAMSELRNQFDALREAVQRYSFACAEVEMRLALIRARADDTGEAAENLRRSLEEQTAASDELRNMARSLH